MRYIALLLLLSGCSSHRIGGQFVYEYGDAVSNPAQMAIETKQQAASVEKPKAVEVSNENLQRNLFAPGREPF